MSTNKWQTDREGFVQAVENDEYAELELSTGDTLITDWEGDGVFNPYVELTADHGDKHPTDILDDVAAAIEDALGVYVDVLEYDTNTDVLVPYCERRPTMDE